MNPAFQCQVPVWPRGLQLVAAAREASILAAIIERIGTPISCNLVARKVAKAANLSPPAFCLNSIPS
jgi:hypothetical protein